MARSMDVEYRLPVTVVRFSAIRTTTKKKFDPDSEETKVTSGATIEVRADPRDPRFVTIPDIEQEDLHVGLTLLDDGRLASTDSSWDEHRGVGWAAALNNAAMLGAAGGIIGGPVGAVAGAIVGSVGTLLATAPSSRLADDVEVAFDSVGTRIMGIVPIDGTSFGPVEVASAGVVPAPALPKPEDVGVEPRYLVDEEGEGDALVAFRFAIGQLVQQHVATALAADPGPRQADRLLAIERALTSVQRVAKRSEDLYADWLAKQVEEHKEVVELQYYADQLPTEAELNTQLVKRSGARPLWWEDMRRVELMVTIDLQSPPPPPVRGKRANDPKTVAFRPPQPAKIQTWRVRHDPSRSPSVSAQLESVSWALVTVPRYESRVEAPVLYNAKSKLELAFSTAGALTKVSTDQTGAGAVRAATVAGLPAGLATALTTGTALGNAFSPTAMETARLKAEVDQADLRSKLAPAGTDPHKDLKDAVALAELNARLALANQLATDPSHVVFFAGSEGS